MNGGPNIARIGALLGDQARAEILAALLGGKALTATELAHVANVTKQTASAHLGKLTDSKLITLERQGRHRYFRLADDDVAQLLEGLMGFADRKGAVRLQTGPREPALRKARVCYDHLAGEIAVAIFDSLKTRRLIRVTEEQASLTMQGEQFFHRWGIDVTELRENRRPLCRTCLDWSMRRAHLAGTLGAAMLSRLFALKWARRAKDSSDNSRIVIFTPQGEHAVRKLFALPR